MSSRGVNTTRVVRNALMASIGRAFERHCLELLTTQFPLIEQSEEVGEYDQSGFDLFVRDPKDPFVLDHVFQCKASQVKPGPRHLQRALHSIKAFRKSGLRARAYVLIFNKPLHDPAFRGRIVAELEGLKRDALIGSYLLLDLEAFITWLMEFLKADMLRRITDNGALFRQALGSEAAEAFYLDDVPCTLNGKPGSRPVQQLVKVTAPGVSNASHEEGKYLFVTGEFGFGKTTMLLEFAQRLEQEGKGRRCIYVPVTVLESNAFGSEGNFVNALRAVLCPFAPESPLENKLRAAILQQLLKNDSGLVLLLDGLDEHKFFKNVNNLQRMFNSLTLFKSPIVFGMRSEFYHERKLDLDRAIGRHRRVQDRFVLTDWEDKHILAYVDHWLKAVEPKGVERKRVMAFRTMVHAGAYKQTLGDIPKRPLFLRMVLEDVRSGELSEGRLTLAALYERYILEKITRDLTGVLKDVVPDRGVNADMGIAQLAQTVFRVLEEVTIFMYYDAQGRTYLTNSINAERLQERLTGSVFTSRLDLALHSVLLPTKEQGVSGNFYQFAHFSFLEYFFARNLVVNLWNDEDHWMLNPDNSVVRFIVELIPLMWPSEQILGFMNATGWVGSELTPKVRVGLRERNWTG